MFRWLSSCVLLILGGFLLLVLVQASMPALTPAQQRGKDADICRMTARDHVPHEYNTRQTNDRDFYYAQCMQGKGYGPATKPMPPR